MNETSNSSVASAIVWELARKEAIEQVHEKTQKLLRQGNEAKEQGDLKRAQELLLEAWDLISDNIEPPKS